MANRFRPLLKLFWPIFIANIGVFTLSLVDSLMLAHSNARHLGLQSIGDAASDADVCRESSIHELTRNTYKITVSSKNTSWQLLSSDKFLIQYFGQNEYNEDQYCRLSRKDEERFYKAHKKLQSHKQPPVNLGQHIR